MNLPKISVSNTLMPIYRAYLSELAKQPSFTGEIKIDWSTRMLMATDNSVYEVIPQAVCFPRNQNDVVIMLRLASQSTFTAIQFSSRGGGTGTNGQSLTSGIMIDFSKHVNQILNFNKEKKIIEVEPGVVLDQLNDYLAAHDLFFSPSLSPSASATLGGMFATDACGKGSCCYGRTSDHVIGATVILANGECIEISSEEKVTYPSGSRMWAASDKIHPLLVLHEGAINQKFAHLPRRIAGYNLLSALNKSAKSVDFRYLFGGSEGTLGLVTKLTLKLTELPKYTTLFAIRYASFQEALESGVALLDFKPTAIETLDDNIMQIAKTDEVYTAVKKIFKDNAFIKGVNLVEFAGDCLDEMSQQVTQLQEALLKKDIEFYCTENKSEIKALWDLRKKSVGLLANLSGDKQPVPFVEDTCVPPKSLPAYIAEFRKLLEEYHLTYGMFGHVDAGCLHVRPALNMQNPVDANLLPEITAKVYGLVKKYQGMMWSEHGRGYRTEQTEDFFGDKLYGVLREIKTIFDPHDQLNPGKIVTALHNNQKIVEVDGPFRGKKDQKINQEAKQLFSKIIRCNGNAACFQYAADKVICPSYHATRDRIHSPKGRSVLIREWLRQLSGHSFHQTKKVVFRRKIAPDDFSTQVYDAMSGCLGCKGCASGCPVHVNIPEYKSIFLNQFFKRYRRPLKDYLIAYNEFLLPIMAHFPQLFNSRIQKIWLKSIGLIDLPALPAMSLKKRCGQHQVTPFSLKTLAQMDVEKTVCISVEPYVGVFKPHWIMDTYVVLKKLGFNPVILPMKPTGKPMHAKGFLEGFEKCVKKQANFYNKIARLGFPIIGLDPAITLSYRDEYAKVLNDKNHFKILLLQEWLMSVKEKWCDQVALNPENKTYYLFSHCTEKSLNQSCETDWQEIYKSFGLSLKPIQVGCCGMSGSFGHEKQHQTVSKTLFEMSWSDKMPSDEMRKNILVTGFSCACQVARLKAFEPSHPVAVLKNVLDT